MVLCAVLSLTLLVLHQGALPPATNFVWLFPAVVVLGIPILAFQELYLAIIRFVGTRMVLAVLYGTAILAVTMTALAGILGVEAGVQLASFALVFYAFAVLGLTTTRFLMRALVSDRRNRGRAGGDLRCGSCRFAPGGSGNGSP